MDPPSKEKSASTELPRKSISFQCVEAIEMLDRCFSAQSNVSLRFNNARTQLTQLCNMQHASHKTLSNALWKAAQICGRLPTTHM